MALTAPSSPSARAGGPALAGKVVAIDPGHNPNNWKHLAQIDKTSANIIDGRFGQTG